MKKRFLGVLMVSLALGLIGCKEEPQPQPGPEPEPVGQLKVVVDFQNDGGANIPTSWNDEDTAETVRKATYYVNAQEFSIEFVGKWYNSSTYGEYQTKKDPVSYIRSASTLEVKKVVIEDFKAVSKVYLTNDHTGDEVVGSNDIAVHEDGTATSYTLNSANWSILASETLKGKSINYYSFTFYF